MNVVFTEGNKGCQEADCTLKRRAFAPLVSSSADVWWNERFNDTFCGCDNVIVMFGCFKERLSFRNAVLVSMGCHNKIQQTGWLRQQEFLSHGLRDWKSDIKVPARSVPGESTILGWLVAPVSPGTHMAFPWCLSVEREVSSLMSPLTRVLIPSWASHPHDLG